ncbi:MAG: phosphate/phosphite/phosphonate ABC transporter substrate-binding protein [Chloroflexi bacterium]|nr:phosphate/phosphite/phosphonate ABC transporter substrate-binding protein [Chloroflexota bacterium]
MKSRFFLILVILMAIFLTACDNDDETSDDENEPTEAADAEDVTRDQIIVIADISDDVVDTTEEFQPFADYLAANLSEQGIVAGQVTVAADFDEMVEMIENGEVDIYFDSVYPASVIAERTGADLVLRRWKDRVDQYNSIIFTSTESGIETVDDLPGGMVAFDEATSTSGFVLPLVYLVEQGHSLTLYEDIEAEVAGDEIGYIFSGDDDNSILWVLENRVAAGAVGSTDYFDLDEDVLSQLVILGETEFVPRQVVIIRDDLPDELKQGIVNVMLQVGNDTSAAEILDTFEDTEKFDEFPEGIEAAIARMNELRDTAAEYLAQ